MIIKISLMFIKVFPVGPFQSNCIILADEDSREGFIIDPGDEAERIIDLVHDENLKVQSILLTHAHLDHIRGVPLVAAKLEVEVYLHEADQPLYEKMAMQAEMLGVPGDEVVMPETRFLNDGDVLKASGLRVKVICTPGHSPGGVCYLVDDGDCAARAQHAAPLLVCGDTLFQGSLGRTDLWGGDYELLIASIREKILVLPDETVVVPGHGGETTVGAEMRGNPFLR